MAALAPLPAEKRGRLDQAEQSEYRDHDDDKAIEIYKSLIKETDSSRWKAILLTSLKPPPK